MSTTNEISATVQPSEANASRRPILLSICIPTYNRAHTLRRLLERVSAEIAASGMAGNIEVVVSDNASEDGTRELIQHHAQCGMPIVYFRQEHNVGFGGNLTRAVDLASGQYCWLLGSDDTLIPGALAYVSSQLLDESDVLLGWVVTNGRVRKLLAGNQRARTVRDRASVLDYLHECTEISALFAFMSAIIVRKEYWRSIPDHAELVAHPYTHQLRLFRAMAQSGTRLVNLQKPIVDTGEEGNEWDAQMWKHFRLDCMTIRRIAIESFEGDPLIDKALGVVFRAQYGTKKLLSARAGMDVNAWAELVPVLRGWGYPNSLLVKKNYDRAIFGAYMIAKALKRWIRK